MNEPPPAGHPQVPARLLAAAAFAARKHKDQRRKGADASPYINHPLDVAERLASAGVLDLVTLQAAILHDTLEDTETTAEELEAHFGAEVCRVVLEVTDDKSLPKEERKRRQVEHAAHISERAKLVKLSDKTSNVRDVTQDPPTGWSTERRLEYLAWATEVVDQVRGVHPELEARFDAAVAEGKRRLGAAASSHARGGFGETHLMLGLLPSVIGVILAVTVMIEPFWALRLEGRSFWEALAGAAAARTPILVACLVLVLWPVLSPVASFILESLRALIRGEPPPPAE